MGSRESEERQGAGMAYGKGVYAHWHSGCVREFAQRAGHGITDGTLV